MALTTPTETQARWRSKTRAVAPKKPNTHQSSELVIDCCYGCPVAGPGAGWYTCEPPTEHVLIEDFRTLRDIGSRKRDDRTLHFRVSDPVEKVLLNDPIFYPFQLLMPAIYTSFRVPRIRSRLSAQQISSVPF